MIEKKSNTFNVSFFQSELFETKTERFCFDCLEATQTNDAYFNKSIDDEE